MILWKYCLTSCTYLEYTAWQRDGLNLQDRRPLQVHRSPTCDQRGLVCGSTWWFFLGRVLWFWFFPERQTPKAGCAIFQPPKHQALKSSACFCLCFLPRCYFITPTRLCMKRLRDGSEVTNQTNGLHIHSHPACESAARLRKGFKSTERVTAFYLQTLFFPFLGLGENHPHIPRFTSAAIQSAASVNQARITKFWKSSKGKNLRNKLIFQAQIKMLIFSSSHLIILNLITRGNKPCLIMDRNINNILLVFKMA